MDKASTERYCDVGEVLLYQSLLSSDDANEHSCMERCSEGVNEILVRGLIDGDMFYCYCSDVLDIDSCVLKEGGTQYKVTRTDSHCQCPGFYIFDGHARSCPPGRYSGYENSCLSTCKLCPVGKFSESGSLECESCPAGKIQETETTCSDCPEGKYSPAGSNECIKCELGLFTNFVGSPQCLQCPEGYYDNNLNDGTSCKLCALGKFSGLGTKNSCTNCPSGFFSDITPTGQCKACSAGRYQSFTGQTTSSSCKVCPIGYYNSQSGQPACPACSSGKYQSSTGKTGCVNCPKGFYAATNGWSFCFDCPKGYYASMVAASSCYACQVGRYSDNRGTTVCKSCPPGTYNNQKGQDTSSECHACPNGRYQPHQAASSCYSCGKLYNSYSWAILPDRITFEKSCDQIKTSSIPSCNDMYYEDSDGPDDSAYRCTRYGSGEDSGYGDRWRAPCLAKRAESCPYIEYYHHGGTTGTFYEVSCGWFWWKQCWPHNMQFYD